MVDLVIQPIRQQQQSCCCFFFNEATEYSGLVLDVQPLFLNMYVAFSHIRVEYNMRIYTRVYIWM